MTLALASLVVLPAEAATVGACSDATTSNPRPAGWFMLGKPSQAFSDNCFHQFMVNEPDTATVDVVILPPVGPLANRDISLLRQSVQMWEDGVNGMARATGRTWLAEQFHINPFVLGLDTAQPGYAAAVADPEVVIVTADAEGGAVTGFVGQGSDQFDGCHGMPNPFVSSSVIVGLPGFDDHHGQGWGTLDASCGDWGGRVCVVAQAALFIVPDQEMALNIFDLNAHEFGHCLGLGHVGDASDFAAMAYPPDDIMSYEQDGWDPEVGLCVSNLDVKTLAYRYHPLVATPPATREPGLIGSYMTMEGGKLTWPGNAVGPEYLGTTWRALREDGTLTPTATECPQPTVDLLADPLAIPAPKEYEGGSTGGTPTVTITTPASGATGVTAPVTVSGGVDRIGSTSTSSSSTTTTTSSSSTTTTGSGSAPSALHFTATRVGGTDSPDCGMLPSYRMHATAPTGTTDSKAYAARGFGPLACPMDFAAPAASGYTLPAAVQVEAWLGCDLPTAAPQDAVTSPVGIPYNVDWKLTIDGVDVPNAISGSGGTFLCDGSAPVPVQATIATGGVPVPAGAVLGVTASTFWLTLGAEDPQPNLHVLTGSVAHDSRLQLEPAGAGASASADLGLWDRILLFFTGGRDEPSAASFSPADVVPPSRPPTVVAAATPRAAPTEAPANPQVSDAGADVTGLGVAPIDHMDIRAAWFDSDSDYLYVGLQLTDIPADPAATSQVAYTVNFMPTWATTWDGVAPGDRFDGLRVNALWSRVDFNTLPPGTPSSTTFSLEVMSATVNPQTEAETGHFGHVADITGSVDATTDIIWFQVPREDLLSPADGALLDTLSAASVPAVGGLVTAGSFYGDAAQAASTEVSYAMTAGGGGGGGDAERVELYEGSTLLGSDEVTTSGGSPTASWSVAGLDLAPGAHTLTAKWFDAEVASTGTPLDTETVAFTVASDTDPCDGNVAPVISAVAADPGTTTAVVTWTTDEASSSVVDYGATEAYGSQGTGAMGTSHSVALSGLTAATTYHFRVTSEDDCGDESSSADGTFTTDEEETVDDTEAFVQITSPVDDFASSSGLFTVSGNAGHVEVETVDPDSNGDGFVVIAIPDTGVNPYHDDFAGDLYPRNTDSDPANDVDFSKYPATYLDGFPAAGPTGATTLALTIDGSFNAAADSAKFGGVAMQTLHWIPGTKIIGAYDYNNVQPVNAAADAIHILDEDGHGTASASVAVGNYDGSCPECLLVVVEGLDGGAWAFTQPWIDIVSTSGGPVANIPTVFGVEDGHMPTIDGQRDAAERGQSILYAGGNGCLTYVCPEQTYLSQNTGPAWTLDIGAMIRADDGHDESIILSGKPVTMSSYSAGIIPAACRTGTGAGECQHSGTSAATPITAGHFGEVLMEARRLLGSDAIGNQRVSGTGVVASGTPVAGSPYLEDGLFTRAELWDIMFHSAQPLSGEVFGTVHFRPTGIPGSPVDYAYAGYGIANDAMEQKALKVLRGEESGLDKSDAETFFAGDRAIRDGLWGGWDDDVDTIGDSSSASLQLALPLASMPSAACTGTADAGTVSVYLDAAAPENLLGSDSLAGPLGACSDGWSVDVDLSEDALGDHQIIAVYSDGLGGSAQDTVDIALIEALTLEFGEPLEVTLAEGVARTLEIDVPAGHGLLSFELSGPPCEDDTPLVGACSFDVDLFVDQGEPQVYYGDPSGMDVTGGDPNACSSALAGNDESCDLVAPAAGTWYVLLDPFSGSGTVTLRADLDLADQDGDSTPDHRDADRDGDSLDNEVESVLGTNPDGVLGACIPNAGSQPGFQDKDGDGQLALYARSRSTSVELGAEPTFTVEQRDCWLAGDPDDDGGQHAGVGVPYGSACVPNGGSRPAFQDKDRDGEMALYALSRSSEVTPGPPPTVTTVKRDCWLAGDPDDDGGAHTGVGVPASTTVCVPNGGSRPAAADKDGDGVPAVYLTWRNTEVTVDASPSTATSAEECWFGGDPDDDGADRAPAGVPEGSLSASALEPEAPGIGNWLGLVGRWLGLA